MACVNEESGFLIWDLYDGNRIIYSVILDSNQNSRFFFQPIMESMLTAEITFRNSSALASTLTLTDYSTSTVNGIGCVGNNKEFLHPQSFSSEYNILRKV